MRVCMLEVDGICTLPSSSLWCWPLASSCTVTHVHAHAHTYSVYTHIHTLKEEEGNVNTEQPWIIPGERARTRTGFLPDSSCDVSLSSLEAGGQVGVIDKRSTPQSRNQCLLLSLEWTALCVPTESLGLSVDVSRILVGPEWSCVCLEYTNILNLRFQWCILLVRSMSLVLWCPMWKSNSSVEVSLFQLIAFVTREPSVSCTLREAIVRSWEYSYDPGRQTGWTWESVLWVSYTFSSLCFQVTQQIPAICQNNSGIRVAQWLSGFLKWG